MIIIGLLIFILLVVAHEYGHFLAAKRGGVEVEEFGIGFPPKMVGKTMGKGIFRSYYTLNWLPLGGFVKLKGENSADTRPGSFGAVSFGRKVLIMIAGVGMNLVMAVILLGIVSATALPTFIENQYVFSSAEIIEPSIITIDNVAEDGPAALAGIMNGDEVVSFNGQTYKTAAALINDYAENEGSEVEFVLDRNGDIVETTVSFNSSGSDAFEDLGYSGAAVIQDQIEITQAPWYGAILSGLVLTAQFTLETFALLGNMIAQLFAGNTEAAAQGVSGPVGIFYVFSQVDSVVQILAIGGLISVSLAVMNILPIPALDGGRLTVTAVFKLLNKPLPEELENKIHGYGMTFLLLLVALITVVDIQRIF